MKVQKLLPAVLVTIFFLTGSARVLAHGMEITLDSEGDQLSGQVIYSDGRPGAGDFINIENVTNPHLAPFTATTNADGRFAVTGIIGQEYLITAHGEEGHTVTAQTVLGVTAPVPEGTGIPFYVIAGILLLVSIIPAQYLSNRSRRSAG